MNFLKRLFFRKKEEKKEFFKFDIIPGETKRYVAVGTIYEDPYYVDATLLDKELNLKTTVGKIGEVLVIDSDGGKTIFERHTFENNYNEVENDKGNF